MSRGGKVAVVGSLIFSGLVIYGVHYQQRKERETMHYGVIKDAERQRLKKLQNLQDLEAQRALQTELEKDQSVRR
ncbi:hypothetical protein IWQ60_004953 [Tieghemiomyces parasiticus]|uniref:Cytochrome c oxidase assembly protein n=1 Tax=Tieghemiomyces parasiticus TaxID=78921 RepID=A0A9W8AAF2_9FUNG|nr:hypothetical protein IWQ60_004953 [Tieghemiomyces parasiticus]